MLVADPVKVKSTDNTEYIASLATIQRYPDCVLAQHLGREQCTNGGAQIPTLYVQTKPAILSRLLTWMNDKNEKALFTLSSQEWCETKRTAKALGLGELVCLMKCLRPKLQLGTHCILQEGNAHRILKTGPSAWDAIIKGTPFPRDKAKVRAGMLLAKSARGHVMFGICPSILDPLESNTFNKCGFYFYLNTSGLYSGAPYSYSNFEAGEYGSYGLLPQGSFVGLEYDREHRILSFFVDGFSLGIAYSNLPDVPMSLCIHMYDQHDVVEVCPF